MGRKDKEISLSGEMTGQQVLEQKKKKKRKKIVLTVVIIVIVVLLLVIAGVAIAVYLASWVIYLVFDLISRPLFKVMKKTIRFWEYGI